MATIAMFYAECYDDLQALLDAAASKAYSSADGLLLVPVLAQRAWLARRRSDLTAAEADARALLEDLDLPVPLLHRLLTVAVLVDTLVDRGQLDEAERQLEPLRSELQTTSQTAALLRHARGRLRLFQLRFAEALCDFEAAGEIAKRSLATSPCFLPWRSFAAVARRALGDADEAALE
jgi:hypothetical protein